MSVAPQLRDVLARLYRAHVDDLSRRYGEVLARLGHDAVVLHSGTPKLRSPYDDQYWPLRVTPHFQHWLPLEHADCALVVAPGKRPTLLWPRATSFWEQPAEPEVEFWKETLDVVELATPRDVKGHLPTGASGRIAFVGDGSAAFDWGLPSEAINPHELVLALDQLRVHKTPYEIACLAEANRRAAVGHARVAAAFRAGDHAELELHLAYLAATQQDDAETPYKNIVALGAHASTLHHVAYGRSPSPARSLLLDAGATFLGYASDITRTYAREAGPAESTFAQLLDGMNRMQLRLVADVKVGVPYEDLHEEAHRFVASLLAETGVVRGASVEAMTDGDITRTFFPHGLGHSLGLQTHDVGCAVVRPKPRNPWLRNTTAVSVDQVFTIEPGLYFIPALLDELRARPEGAAVDWHLVEALRPLGGIRVEDDVVVTGPGTIRNLTREVLA